VNSGRPLAPAAPLTRAVGGHAVWREVAPQFSMREFNQPERMAVEALRLLHRVRMRSGIPFRFVSDARTPSTNPGVSNSAHLELPCTAVDLRVVSNLERYRIVEAAIAEGVGRIGAYPPTPFQRSQWGAGAGSVHLDASQRLPSPRLWLQF
jgi:hypothetical protein